MRRDHLRRILLLAAVAGGLWYAKAQLPDDTIKARQDLITTQAKLTLTNAPEGKFRVNPGPDDGRIASVTAGLMEQLHYSHRPFDDALSSQFLDLYLESLDPQHLHFLQSDIAQFEHYRN